MSNVFPILNVNFASHLPEGCLDFLKIDWQTTLYPRAVIGAAMRRENNPSATEHRSPQRRLGAPFMYEIRMAVRFSTLDKRAIEGAGETRRIGSKSIVFVSPNSLPLGAAVRLMLAWPVKLDDGCPLQLVMQGRVASSAGSKTTVEVTRYEFRTAARTGFATLSAGAAA